MRLGIVTLFPELFEAFLVTSFVGRATSTKALEVHCENLRKHGIGKHLSVDDTPYGGGSGMVMRADCVVAAVESAEVTLGVERAHRVLLTPQGKPLRQDIARALAEKPAAVLICGRYEGFDERVRTFVDEEISVGDFVLTGGEVAAMCVIESFIRFMPGILGNEASKTEESFSAECGGMLEYPQYTRPQAFRGLEVPEILRSGDHQKVAAWRQEQSLLRTRSRRPDLVVEPPPEKRRSK
jgi:tRNA (guanine37-N1)-methyltransferase